MIDSALRQPRCHGPRLLFAGVAAYASALSATAEVTLPAVLGDGMVLQRETEAAVWGWAAPGERVKVQGSWGADAAEAVADSRGRWLTRVDTPAAGGPYLLSISGRNTITLQNVMVGEVWICSGQSNMEWPLTRVRDSAAEIAGADDPRIRLFMVPNTIATRPRSDCGGSWVECSPEAVASFSATGYFFGRDLLEHLDVPIGLISADWGGTVAEAWTSAETLAGFPQFASSLEFLDVVSDPTRRVDVLETRMAKWWSDLDDGASLSASWTDTGYDDSEWKPIRVPSTWDGDELGAFDGVVFQRKTFELPRAWDRSAAKLTLGPIDDYDDAWINGVHVGAVHEAGNWQSPRIYDVPAGTLRAGRNVVAVRVLDTGGLGGTNGSPEQVALVGPGDIGTLTLAGEWKYLRGRAVSELPRRPQGAKVGPNTATALYNGMIAPLVPYSIRGAIWYQGESNRNAARLYRDLFPSMIEDWRGKWGQGDFPFYFVQIAPYNYGGDKGQTAKLREAQLMTLATPNTGMVVTMDIGNPGDIHPRNKQDVGGRLALWARAQTYGERGLAFSGPLYKSIRVDGTAIRVQFDHVFGGLELRQSERSHFLVAGADRKFVEAEATIDGYEIVVSSPWVTDPVAVRYGWEAAAEPNLFNREGLPASPFRSDDW